MATPAMWSKINVSLLEVLEATKKVLVLTDLRDNAMSNSILRYSNIIYTSMHKGHFVKDQGCRASGESLYWKTAIQNEQKYGPYVTDFFRTATNQSYSM